MCRREEALDLLEQAAFNVVVLDMMMPGISGLDVLKELRNRHTECEVVVLTGEATVESAVEAMKLCSRVSHQADQLERTRSRCV